MKYKLPVILCVLLFWFFQCSKSKDEQLFTLIDPDHSGVHFENTITETDSMNAIRFEYIYNGGGVGIGDFNRDGLPDIFFAGNIVSSKLFLNKGSLNFTDITDAAGVGGERSEERR